MHNYPNDGYIVLMFIQLYIIETEVSVGELEQWGMKSNRKRDWILLPTKRVD